MIGIRHLAAAVALASLLPGCAATDPLLNANDWNPTGANESNIAAQVADPADLVRGRGSRQGSDGQLAAAAIQRLRAGRVKPLPDSGLTDVRVQSSPAQAASP